MDHAQRGGSGHRRSHLRLLARLQRPLTRGRDDYFKVPGQRGTSTVRRVPVDDGRAGCRRWMGCASAADRSADSVGKEGKCFCWPGSDAAGPRTLRRESRACAEARKARQLSDEACVFESCDACIWRCGGPTSAAGPVCSPRSLCPRPLTRRRGMWCVFRNCARASLRAGSDAGRNICITLMMSSRKKPEMQYGWLAS